MTKSDKLKKHEHMNIKVKILIARVGWVFFKIFGWENFTKFRKKSVFSWSLMTKSECLRKKPHYFRK
jgi:hypothetical protein